MRQWHINPKFMCRQHLLGEHVEHHMFVGAITKDKNIRGYITKGLVVLSTLQSRHDELVKEMIDRGYNHKSPLHFHSDNSICHMNTWRNLHELISRCPQCKKRYKRYA